MPRTAALTPEQVPANSKPTLDAFTKNCGFADYNECTTVAKNATSLATGVGECVRNPDYRPPAAPARAKPAAGKTPNPQR